MKITAAALVFVSLLAVSSAFAQSDAPTVTDANNVPELNGALQQDGQQPADQGGQQDAQEPETETRIVEPTVQHVTSLQKCLDQLDPDDAAEVRLNPEHPYQECITRLADKASKKRHFKVTKEKGDNDDDEAESPRNFKRVNDGASDTAGKMPSMNDKSDPDTNSGYWVSGAKPKPYPVPPQEEKAPPGLMPDDVDEDTDKPKHAKKSWMPEIKPDNSKANYNN